MACSRYVWLAALTRRFQGKARAQLRPPQNLMPIVDTGGVAGSTTGIRPKSSLRSDAADEAVA